LIRVDDLDERLPESLFVLVLPPDDHRGRGVELWRTHRQDLTAVVYSSIQALVAACGAGQPWVAITRDQLADICCEHEITLLALDMPLPEGHRYPEPEIREQPDLEEVEPLANDGLLYVPARPMKSLNQWVELELQPDDRGRLMLLAYTSPQQLEAGCGPYQAWVSIPSDLISEAACRSGADGVLFNPILAEESRHTAPVADWTTNQ
jgi:hypothetical protein